jgi:membrane-associated protease RseP (regulator of RpoE activity)
MAMTSTAMPNQTPNTTLKTVLVVAVCLGVLVLCALCFALGCLVGGRFQPRSETQVIAPPVPPALVVEPQTRPALAAPVARPRRVIGVGVMLARDKKTRKWMIRGVFPNSPAARAGIQNGTLFEAVDGQPVEDLRVEEVTALLTGSAGSKVSLDLLNRELTETNRLELIRAEFVNGIAVTNDVP